MTASRLFKILLLIAVATGLMAYVPYIQTGDLPPPLLPRISVIALAAAVVAALVGAETRPRLMLRFLAALFALLGVIACAADFAIGRPEAASAATSSFTLLDHLNSFAPSMVMSLEGGISRIAGAWAWNPLLTSILQLPAYLVFFILAIVAGLAGRPRRTVKIFVN